jgi:hypothetical protein
MEASHPFTLSLGFEIAVGTQEVADSTTGDDGAFDFKAIAPGLYFLQIVPKTGKDFHFYKAEGNIAVYVSPDSSRDSLMIRKVNTSCGLSYDLDENKAHYRKLALGAASKWNAITKSQLLTP